MGKSITFAETTNGNAFMNEDWFHTVVDKSSFSFLAGEFLICQLKWAEMTTYCL